MESRYVRHLRESIGHQLLLLPSVTILLFDARDRLLLVRHSNRGLWVAPGGMIEPDETPLEAKYLALDELPALPLAQWLPVVLEDALPRRAER